MNPLRLLNKYINGNYHVKIYNDGTKVRMSEDGTYVPEFPESIDLTITEYCDGGCKWCYAGCSTKGEHCDFSKYRELLDSLHPGTELAINGNDVSHPQLNEFLCYMKDREVLVNMTVSYQHFARNTRTLYEWCDNGYIHGLGVSYNHDLMYLKQLDELKCTPNVVIHVVAGLITLEDMDFLARSNFKVLVLGYKDVGRGINYHKNYKNEIDHNISDLGEYLKTNMDKFNVISFDNLAIRQLDIENKLSNKVFSKLYMGDDAQFTFFINLVQGYYSESSLSTNKYKIDSNNISELFSRIRR